MHLIYLDLGQRYTMEERELFMIWKDPKMLFNNLKSLLMILQNNDL